MSAQTGVELPAGPASRRLGDRMRYRVAIWRDAPNPLWVREMRQAARLTRTPLILMVLTVMMTLLMATIGALMSGSRSPAEAGTVLFHVYFSLAYFVVTMVGPAIAANTIASEREGRTWEAVLLTGMRPEEVARGKFMSAYTAIAMFVVMLAPVGALPFLFGGITPLEVLVAFVFLFLVALLSVAFGLAISSKMASLRGALLVTLLAAVPLSTFCFSTFGLGLSSLARDVWDTVDASGPVWLPAAYGRAPFGAEYVVYLMALPAAVITLPAWLLYEVTRANLTSVTDDRSHGLKRWFLVAALVCTLSAMVPMFAASSRDYAVALVAGMSAMVVFIIFNAFLFAGEPIGPSRRVKRMLAGSGAFRRFLSPGVMRAAQLQMMVAVLSLVALCMVGISVVQTARGVPRVDEQTEQLVVFSLYALGFSTFVIGLAAYLRARATGSAVPRVLLLVVLFFLAAGPWILAIISGVIASSGSGTGDEYALAAPSPFYVFLALDALTRPDPGVTVVASITASIGYAALGLAFLVVARSKCKAIIDEHEDVLAEADRRLAEEDALTAQSREEARAAALAELEQPHSIESAVAVHAAHQSQRPPAPDEAAPPSAEAPEAFSGASPEDASAEPPAGTAEIHPVIEIGHTSDDDVG
jgi:hypothetical protein